MGPQHPSTGVLKVVLDLEGERIVKATPVMATFIAGREAGRTEARIITHSAYR
jgi:NADH:ubiquinone oxidoreductase subunit D